MPEKKQKNDSYAKFLLVREEILRHKWIESQKASKDVGLDTSLEDWIRKHGQKFVDELKERMDEHTKIL